MAAWEQGYPTRDEGLYNHFHIAPAVMHSGRKEYEPEQYSPTGGVPAWKRVFHRRNNAFGPKPVMAGG